MQAKESSSTNLYRPNIPKKTIDDDNGEWVTVGNPKFKRKSADRKSKSDKVNDRKKRNLEYRLNKSINEYLSKQEKVNENLFVIKLIEDKVKITDNTLKEKINKYLSLLEKNLETVKKARTFGFLNSMKTQTEDIVNKLDKILSEDNLYMYAGKGMIVNNDETSLFTNEKYSSLEEKYNSYLSEQDAIRLKAEEERKQSEEKKANALKSNKVFDISKSKIKTGTSFADLFKSN